MKKDKEKDLIPKISAHVQFETVSPATKLLEKQEDVRSARIIRSAEGGVQEVRFVIWQARGDLQVRSRRRTKTSSDCYSYLRRVRLLSTPTHWYFSEARVICMEMSRRNRK